MRGETHQGYSADSAWARGQAWGIYGIALSFRYTKDATYVKLFEEVADYFIGHLPENLIPYWDFVFTDGSGEPQFLKKAAALAALAGEALTEHSLLFGEGVPRCKKSSRGCYPVDIGYNVEETLPSLALYGTLSGDRAALETAEKGLLKGYTACGAAGQKPSLCLHLRMERGCTPCQSRIYRGDGDLPGYQQK